MIKVTDKEIETVSALEPFKRYQYAVKRIADSELLYSLIDQEGNWASSEVENNKLMSIRPANVFAKHCAIGPWSGFKFREITLETFQEEIIDFIRQGNLLLNIFPVNFKTGFVVDIDEFVRDLVDELKKYS